MIEKEPRVILDAGANIGLASIYFANKYPDAKIVAIEPESSNFEMLKKNIEPYSNIVAIQAALWGENKSILVVDSGLDKCGFMTVSASDKGLDVDQSDVFSGGLQVPGVTIESIMQNYNVAEIGILKIDIEGAEKEVFSTHHFGLIM